MKKPRKTAASKNTRPTSAPSSYDYANGWGYEVDYLGTSTRSGLYGDKASSQGRCGTSSTDRP